MNDENLSTEKKPAYWAVLPSSVRYDERLTGSAKLLYAELSSLAGSYGYCWADNAYFERLYGISERTVIRRLQDLADCGYIRIEAAGTTKRRIYAGINPLLGAGPNAEGGPPRASAPTGKKSATDKNGSGTDKIGSGTDKNGSAIYNRKEDQERGSDPPKAPQGACVWKPERFEAFWRYYPAIPDGNGRGRRPAKARAARAWDKLRPDDATIAAMGASLKRQKESRQWRDGVGIPYASTWLNSRAWEEETVEIPQRAAEGVGPYDARPSEEAVEWV